MWVARVGGEHHILCGWRDGAARAVFFGYAVDIILLT